MRRRKPFKTVIAMLIMISVVVTTGTFAFWASEIQGTSQTVNSTLEIGSAKSVTSEISILPATSSSYGYLVPSNQVANSEGIVTDSVNFLYQLRWLELQDLTQIEGEETYGSIIVDIAYDIVINGETLPLDKELYSNIYDLVNISESINNPEGLILNSLDLEGFEFIATLNEPSNKTDYELIANSMINFYFEFSIDTDVYDLALNFVNMTMNDLLNTGVESSDITLWETEEGDTLTGEDNSTQKYLYFPITQDEYTITVNAQLSDINSTSGGYGIMFDTYFDEDDYSRDTGYILQFDRGYSMGELLVRAREYGSERNPFWRVSSSEELFPSKYDDSSWWVSTHEITIEVTNYDDTTRLATIYIDDILLGSTTYERVDTEEQMYIGFRLWGGSPTEFYSLTVE